MSTEILGQVFNEGIGSGGFAVTIDGKIYVFNPFRINPDITIVKTMGALGQTTGKQGIKTDATATATVQVPFDVDDNPIWIEEGTTITDPDGNNWWVSKAPKERRSGEAHKQDIELELKIN